MKDSNLWSFWDSQSVEHQNDVLEYFENNPLFFDYTKLFKGDSRIDLYHGVVDSLVVLFVLNDLSFADYFFVKFSEYTPDNYNTNSEWGVNWENAKIEIYKLAIAYLN